MKKIVLLAGLLCMGFFANAQLYMGGGISYNHETIEPDPDRINRGKDKSNAFRIAPEIGYSINDKWDIGLTFNFGIRKANQSYESYDYNEYIIILEEREIKAMQWGVAPYVRYSIVEFGKFKVLGRGEIFINGGKREQETFINGYGSIFDKTKFMTYGLNISPMLMYDFSEKFGLWTNLNFLNIGFSYNDIEDGNKITRFNFGANADNLVQVGAITIGASFKF